MESRLHDASGFFLGDRLETRNLDVRPTRLLIPLTQWRRQSVRDVEDAAGIAEAREQVVGVVACLPPNPRKVFGESQQVADRRSAPAIDRLTRVTNGRHRMTAVA